MVYDTLFAHRREARRSSRRWSTSGRSRADKLTWTFTLRDGLEWHDGKPVTAEDCVASIKRWGAARFDGPEAAGLGRRASKAVDDKTFTIVLKEPYGLVLESLGKPSSNVPFMMPKRVAETDPVSRSSRGRSAPARSSSRRTNGSRARRSSTSRTRSTSRAPSRPRAWPAARSPRSTASNGSRSPTRRPQVNALLNGEIDMIE